ncbi:GNAT family N-acetyltransferase [Nonomuraea sp. NPDC050556]|uniref:GNAT family N-acetyltransferase n=1 Tax=Nonomuraea sp. NPDC050556 TaxID=3364369 RepID=UPI0037A93A23
MHLHTIRRPRVDDAADIHALISANDIAVIGAPDSTLDDIADELVEPGFDRDKDGWLAHDADGRLDGWAWAVRKGDSDHVDVEVVIRPGVTGLTDELWKLVVDRAKELTREAGHDGSTLDIGIYRQDVGKAAVVSARGFEPATSFHRMRIDHEGPVDPPAPLPGVTLRTGDNDEVRKHAHQMHQQGFADHFGFVKAEYDDWFNRRDSASTNDWSQVTVAYVDGSPAGMLQGSNMFVPDEDCGYVATLAVIPAFRGRGLGRFLLRTAFAADASRGRKGTILHVDSNNTTPALGLYTSAGMRQVLAIDVWRATL